MRSVAPAHLHRTEDHHTNTNCPNDPSGHWRTSETAALALLNIGRFLIAGRAGVVQALLQFADSVANSFSKFWQLLRPKNQQGNEEDHQQMHRLKQSLTHNRLHEVRERPNLFTILFLDPECGMVVITRRGDHGHSVERVSVQHRRH